MCVLCACPRWPEPSRWDLALPVPSFATHSPAPTFSLLLRVLSCAMPSPGIVTRCLSDFGVTRQGFPLIVEEDLSNLLAQEMISEKDGCVL